VSWKAYEIILRLRSPMHIGWRKTGNLQMTRPYVTGKVLWGALTMRLTRDESDGPATDSGTYQAIGRTVNDTLAFTYFYPALKDGNDYQAHWPWKKDESDFRRRFLSSYQGTALSYPRQSAAQGLLHEVEFISPRTLDTGDPVFLKGYVFEKEGAPEGWKDAFNRLQLGGERGYGWGDVECVKIDERPDRPLFDGAAELKDDAERPVISVQQKGRLLAHTKAENLNASGEIEPLVGREWRSNNPSRQYAGQHVEFTAVCFAPGSGLSKPNDFVINKFGVWRKL